MKKYVVNTKVDSGVSTVASALLRRTVAIQRLISKASLYLFTWRTFLSAAQKIVTLLWTPRPTEVVVAIKMR